MYFDYQFRPVERWPIEPTPSHRRQRGRFKAGYRDTLDLLERELKHLGAKHVVIQAYLQPRDIRNDGMIRADSRPSAPGIILSFESKHGPLSYPCDTFTDWQDNLRAIALAIEHLRAIDRYGVTKRGEQYKGWTALPSPNGDHWSAEEARNFLRSIIGGRVDALPIAVAIRECEFATHPDRGGRAEDFKKVQHARKLLLA